METTRKHKTTCRIRIFRQSKHHYELYLRAAAPAADPGRSKREWQKINAETHLWKNLNETIFGNTRSMNEHLGDDLAGFDVLPEQLHIRMTMEHPLQITSANQAA